MKNEIEAAARFITQLVSQNQPANISETQLQEFRGHLVRLFQERYHDHWFPERPQRGQAFRCIRINSFSRPDPLIQRAAADAGLQYRDLKLPVEFTMWVDPKEVSCRFGEHEGSYCTVASFENGGNGESTNIGVNNIKASSGNSSPMAPLQVSVTEHDHRALAQLHHQQHSPRRVSHRSKLSPTLISPTLHARPVHQQQHQFRVGCFYPNYEPQKSWYAYGNLSPPLALTNYHHHHHHHAPAPKARSSYATGWGLTYMPTTVRYLTNSWPTMGPMVKV